jgi:hypothetical protein
MPGVAAGCDVVGQRGGTEGVHKRYTRGTQGVHKGYTRGTQGVHKGCKWDKAGDTEGAQEEQGWRRREEVENTVNKNAWAQGAHNVSVHVHTRKSHMRRCLYLYT